jgi:hypothetical protein
MESLDDLPERHRSHDTAQGEVSRRLNRFTVRLVFQPKKYQEPRVATTLSLIDSDTGFEFGRFTVYTQLEGTMSGYEVELYERVAKGLRDFLRKSE